LIFSDFASILDLDRSPWNLGIADELGKDVPHAYVVENPYCPDDDGRFSILREPTGDRD
jgi:hypothetical protein